MAEPIIMDEEKDKQIQRESLWGLSEAMVELDRQITKAAEENEGEIPDELWDQMLTLKDASIQKTKNVVAYMHRVEQMTDLVDEEIKRLQELKAMRQRTYNGMARAVVRHILAVEPERRKIDVDLFVISARKSKRLVLDDNFQAPEKYRRQKVIYTTDKKRIKDALKKGQSVEGASLQNHYTLQIK